MSIDERTDSASDKRRSAQRAVLLDAASEMLVRGGHESISLRKLAAKVGTSTMAVYTAFGGRDGLIEALIEEGYNRLSIALAHVPRNKEPLLWLRNLGTSFRHFALENHSYYALMVCVSMPLSPAERSRIPDYADRPVRAITRHPAYNVLLDAIQACIDEGSLPAGLTPVAISEAFWATLHGLCSLELGGFYKNEQDAEAGFSLAAFAVMKGLMTPKGLARLDALLTASATPAVA
ncbi:TetR family transcriptional regulator [Parvibaculum sedimenti]|uniref:TetR family transcriptional regulator n=1 Tax=Parvibaculum sedimenti TaxID=2608632 RepID=A0A6N6VJW0_9HYPH|nr:TetR/AcrR family transcriptional regulator [Parvibaculum sedimenti]KAB7739222.1 TetR family transcriptional regulator [Parvibaculum sedimenti]